MPLSNAARAEKRSRARLQGLCITCCRIPAMPERTVCAVCGAAASKRKARQRAVERERLRSGRPKVIFERAGDLASEYHFYDGAAMHYQEALLSRDVSEIDRSRLAEKLSEVLYRGSRPTEANVWLERALARGLDDPKGGERVVMLLLQASRQLYADRKMNGAFSLIERAIQVADRISNPSLKRLARYSMAGHLRRMERFEESERYLRSCGKTLESDAPLLRSMHEMEHGVLAARAGNAAESVRAFERSIEHAKANGETKQLRRVQEHYAIWMLFLGDIDAAATAHRLALQTARQERVGWIIAYLCAGYAVFLTRMGLYKEAHEHLLEALKFDVQAPALDQLIPIAGMELALHLQDKRILDRCTNPSLLSNAFESGPPRTISTLSAAFAAFYAATGQQPRAQDLLHQTFDVVSSPDLCETLWFEVARHGRTSDVIRARRMLEARVALPANRVARASLAMFDALVANRNRSERDLIPHAISAAEQFEALHWHGYAGRARALLRSETSIPFEMPTTLPKEHVSTPKTPELTERERQVAGLVLQGLTNKEIARDLAIAEHTVESHMRSIMGRLGVRSRHQVIDALANR